MAVIRHLPNPPNSSGPVYDKDEAEARAKVAGWAIAADGDKWRRVVCLAEAGRDSRFARSEALAGARRHRDLRRRRRHSGRPRRDDGSLIGIEAVIDKDAASALLARELGADALLLLTDVDAVYRDYGKENAARIARMTPARPMRSVRPQVRWGRSSPLLPNLQKPAALPGSVD